MKTEGKSLHKQGEGSHYEQDLKILKEPSNVPGKEQPFGRGTQGRSMLGKVGLGGGGGVWGGVL